MKFKKILLKNAFPLFGLGALIWFLIRVIPKPSRASYPCMRIAAPIASSFVLWIIGICVTVFSFRKMRNAFANSSYLQASLFLIICILFIIFSLNSSSKISFAENYSISEKVMPLFPIGEAKGINPGRVVWIWNPDATNEDCTNSYNGDGVADNNDDGWFLDKNNDQNEIDNMLSAGLLELTGSGSEISAWESIFRYFNLNKNGNDVGYTFGEKIFIKINCTSTWGKGESWGNITRENDHVENQSYGIAETSPHLILALLRQLINVYGVQQENISVGDPMRHLYNSSFDKWFSEFPYVHYIANEGGLGREEVIPTEESIIYYSDNGNEILETSDKIYTVMNQADYLINVPTMKAHGLAGVTLFAKNHFGSHTRESAQHLHPGLVAQTNGVPIRTDSSLYRVQVDLMGHEKFGGNQVLFLLDALWSGSEAVDPPTKWDLRPFNGDWTSAIFLSQDMVAIESVAFDFLSAEYDGSYDKNNLQKVNYPNMKGVTDYLRQAASSEYWPAGILYDPEGDGTPISSLGVNEHWNDSFNKQYSRNLGFGDGIELITITQGSAFLESPSILSAIIINNSDVEITWLDNSTNEEGFIIERKENIANSKFVVIDSVGVNQTSYLDISEKYYTSYYYRIAAFNSLSYSQYSTPILVDNIIIVDVGDEEWMSGFILNQNYPNPFNPITTIKYFIPKLSFVTLRVFDVLGNEITNLVNEKKPAGNYEVEFSTSNLSSGVYFYRLQAGDFIDTKKMVLLK